MDTEEDFFRKGTILKFFSQSGYGFIRDEKGQQVYFHLDEIRFVGEPRKRSQIKEGMKVGFDISRTSRGIRATHMKFYGKPPELKEKKPVNKSSSSHAETDKPTTETSPAPFPTGKEANAVPEPPQSPTPAPENHPPSNKPDSE